LSTPPNKSLLAIIFFTVFIYLVGFGILIPIVPILSRDFGATALQTGLLMSVYSFMQFVFAPFWGTLSDRMGRRPILLFCLVGEACSYLIFAWARSLEWLFVARILAGFFGASISTASAYISDITPPNERSKGMALIGAAFGLGFVVGPALGGGLALWGQHISDAPHFQTSFCALWVGALCMGGFFFGLKFLKESLTEKNKNTHSKKRFQLLKHYLAQKTMGAMLSVYFLSSLAMSGMEATLILFMAEKFGWQLQQVSFGFAYIGVITVLSQGVFVRRLIPKLGERKILRIGLASFAIGLTGIAFAPTIPWMGVTMTLLALGTSFTNPATLGSISLLAGTSEQGVTMGVAQSLASLGRILGPALGGIVYEKIAINSPFLVSGFLALSGLTTVIIISKNLPDSGKKVS
jgi:MFS family permease